MNSIDKRTIRRRRAVFLLAVGLLLTAGTAFGATYTLRAAVLPTPLAMPDGTLVTMWGYALVSYDLEDGAGTVVVNGPVTVPGPRLTVPPGQGLTVNLINELGQPVSLIIPGQAMPLDLGAVSPAVARNVDGRIRSFVHETAPAATGTYIWAQMRAGTYLYHSGTHPAVQVQMGLYGAVTKDEVAATLAAPAQVYGQTYNTEVVLLYSEIDPALHQAVADGTYGTLVYPSTINYQPKYFLVNGEAGNSGGPAITAPLGGNLLVRFLNAGLKDHAPQILGTYLTAVAEDGNAYPYVRQHVSLLLAAGKTLDALLDATVAGSYSLFDRRLYRSNVPSVGAPMQTYIVVGTP